MNDQQRAAMQAITDLKRDCPPQLRETVMRLDTALREALAQPQENTARCSGCSKTAKDGWALYCVECWEKAQPQGEPVAWGWRDPDGYISDCICPEEHDRIEGDYTVPLYTTPPSVEAAIEATLEKAAKVCEEPEFYYRTSKLQRTKTAQECAAAIRSMK
jgi:hypothetical protein